MKKYDKNLLISSFISAYSLSSACSEAAQILFDANNLIFSKTKSFLERKINKEDLKMQMKTEKGFINVEAEYHSAERARMDGYSYAFTSNELDCELYSKALDDTGLKHSFAIVIGYR